MEDILNSCEEKMKKTATALKEEYQAIRTGRASASLFDKVKVDYYGTQTPIAQVASISAPEARLVVIQPWDKSLLSPIEKAIQKSELGLNPSNDGKLLRIIFPPLTEDRRKELAKQTKAIAEQSKIAIRNIRREGMEAIKKLEKSGEISEDRRDEEEEELQKLTDKYISLIGDEASAKEKEIMEI